MDWILLTLRLTILCQWQTQTLLWLQRTSCESWLEMSVETKEQQTALFSYSCGFTWWWWHMKMKMCSMNSSCYLSEHLCQHWRICVGVTCKQREERKKKRPCFGKKSLLIKDQQVVLFISWALYSISFPLLVSKSQCSLWTKYVSVWCWRKGWKRWAWMGIMAITIVKSFLSCLLGAYLTFDMLASKWYVSF